MRRLDHLLIVLGTLFYIVTGAAFSSELVADSFKSIVLNREYRLQVYLPDGYRETAGAYPVVYLLHGAGADEYEWTVKGSARETLDGLIRRRLIRPTIAVLPGNNQSWWSNGASEKAETAFMEELLPYIERKYKVSRERSMRSIGGLSMGGYGALNFALKYPDQFCAAAVISPAIYDPLPPETSAARKTPQFVRNGQFDPEIWTSMNYPAHLDRYKVSVQKVPMWIVSGDHDRFGIALMSAQLYWKLFQIQPKQVELRVVDGDHEWMVFRDALPDALRYVDMQCSRGG